MRGALSSCLHSVVLRDGHILVERATIICLRFEVFTAVRVTMFFFRVLTPCKFVVGSVS
jgi:hypothetical protein